MNFYLNSLLLPWTALTTAFSLPQFRQRTVSFSGDGPERSLRHLRAMAAACRTDVGVFPFGQFPFRQFPLRQFHFVNSHFVNFPLCQFPLRQH